MKTIIVSINYNWYSTNENGEEFTNRTVGHQYGESTCTEIKEHSAYGEGDKWYYDIHYSDGTFQRIFNPNQVVFKTTPTP